MNLKESQSTITILLFIVELGSHFKHNNIALDAAWDSSCYIATHDLKSECEVPSHVDPLYSAPQLHSKPPLISVQEPPFLQGFGWHLLCSVEKKDQNSTQNEQL